MAQIVKPDGWPAGFHYSFVELAGDIAWCQCGAVPRLEDESLTALLNVPAQYLDDPMWHLDGLPAGVRLGLG